MYSFRNLTVYDRMIYNQKSKTYNPGTVDWLGKGLILEHLHA